MIVESFTNLYYNYTSIANLFSEAESIYIAENSEDVWWLSDER